MEVSFGTDGWRGIIASDYTFANVRVAAHAVAAWVLEQGAAARGVCVGWDTRFLSQNFAQTVAEVLAASGIPVWLADRITPTPALSFAVRERNAAAGVMITSSHNPAQWNGFKVKASYGGSGTPTVMAAIAAKLGVDADRALQAAEITSVNFLPDYITAITKFVDLEKIAASGYKFAIDCMYGAGREVLHGIFDAHNIPNIEIRAEIDPTFRGIHPEPMEPHIAALQETVVREECDAGLVTDGDADRIGAVDEHGAFVDSHKIFAILLVWLLERRSLPGEVVRCFNSTKMVDRIAIEHGRRLREVPIGFKNICDLMLSEDVLIGGEESGGIGVRGHLPERDGLLNALLLAQVMADEGCTLGELVAKLQAKYGEHQYARLDLHLTEAQKQSAVRRATAGPKEFAGMRVSRQESLDGSKFFLDNPEARSRPSGAESWLLIRASGTEPLLRIYAESCSMESVRALLDAGRRFALEGEA